MKESFVLKRNKIFYNIFMSVLILAVCFGLSMIVQKLFNIPTIVTSICMLGVFLVSLITDGYVYGIVAALLSVLINNFAFTFPYFKVDFIETGNIISGLIMLVVAIMTGMLTTRIKKQEKIKENEKLRANLLRAVSHDLRTPLTTIYGSCSVIIENYDSIKKEQQLKLLGEIREDSENLIRMVENLLSVTKVNDANVHIGKTDTVLEELIDAVIMKFKKNYPDRQIDVNIPDDFISIPMDAILIEQVLMNLMENAAIHATGMTRIELNVSIEDNFARFEVADNGCGIPKERLTNIFSGYVESMKHPADGGRNNMGIGLSVCQAIVRAHGGELLVANRPEGGAIFSFKLEVEGMENE